MGGLKAIVFFHLAVSTVLLTTTPSNGKQLRHVSSSESSHLDNVNELFSTKSKKKKATATGRRKVQLFCRTGFLLEILDNGEVAGTHNESSIYTIIEIQVFGKVLRRLKGIASGRYLSLDDKGRLFSTYEVQQNIDTFFNERYEENNWITYSSSFHSHKKESKQGKGWYIAIKRNGSLKKPYKTRPGMRSTEFLHVENEREADLVKKNLLGD